METSISGGIYNQSFLDLNVQCKNQSLSSVMRHTPNHLKSIYTSFLADGLVSCNANIKGISSNKENPSLKMNMKF